MGATNIVKNSDKEKYVYSGYGITFDSGGSWRFSGVSVEFCLSLHYNDDNSYLFVHGKEIFKFKANNKNVNFPTQFCLGSISNEFSATESREVYSNGNVFDFSVDNNSFDKSDILNIHKHLMTKNNIN